MRYLTCTATECTDGGFDLKSTDVYMENCVSRANKRNYRLWGSGELHGCRSEDPRHHGGSGGAAHRSEEHTSELQSLMRISYAVFCLKKKNETNKHCIITIDN